MMSDYSDVSGAMIYDHQSCRDKYNDPEKWRSQNYDLKDFRNEKEESRDMGFSKLCEVRNRRIVIGKEVLTLIDLRDTFVLILADSPFSNTNYRTGKLKAKLLRHKDYCDKLSCVKLERRGGQLQPELVFRNETSLAEAEKNCYMLGCTNMIDEVGKF